MADLPNMMTTDVLEEAVEEQEAQTVADNGGTVLPIDQDDAEETEEGMKDDDSSSFDTMDEAESDDSVLSDDNANDLLAKAATQKEKGNSFFNDGDLDKAARAYRKGTSLVKPLNKANSGDDQVKALLISLQNNLSMVMFKQEKYKLSRDVATKVLEMEDSNVKALYRRATANRKLGDVKEAKADLTKAYKADPANVAVKKELQAVKAYMEKSKTTEKSQMKKAFSFGLYDDKIELERKKEAEKEAKKQEDDEVLKKRKKEWEDECVTRMANNGEAISYEEWDTERKLRDDAVEALKKQQEKKKRLEKKKKEETSKIAADSDDDDDLLTEQEMAQFRGYKKTKDGKTTSYFHREQSAEEIALLGNTAPQRLEGARVSPENTPTVNKPKASAWNQNGTTWEEKNTTEWCTTTLTQYLKEATAAEESLVAVVKKVNSLTGDASVAIAGGKKRYIFDYHAKLSFEIRNEDDVVAAGSLQLPDINSASHDELEVEMSAWKTTPSEEYSEAANKCRKTLAGSVRSSVQRFVEGFNHHY
jgi:tetratricopeptide (TPR) repeat protein